MVTASFATHLPTVEDASVGSGSTAEQRNTSAFDLNRNNVNNVNNVNNNGNMQPRMKRSPYLSVMAGSTKESEDLVAMLSRPAGTGAVGGGEGGGGGGEGLLSRGSSLHRMGEGDAGGSPSPGGGGLGGGKSNFFDLRRTPVVGSGGGGNDDAGGLNNTLRVPPNNTTTTTNNNNSNNPPLPSLRSALRIGSRTDFQATTKVSSMAQMSEMKKNTSVTFSNTTKRASQLGTVGESQQQQGNARFGNLGSGGNNNNDGGGGHHRQQQQQQQQHHPQQPSRSAAFQMPPSRANYSAAMMMKKSQSIASPQMLLAHQNSASSAGGSSGGTANESFSTNGGGGGNDGGGTSSSSSSDGNAAFPIYFSKLPGEEEEGNDDEDEEETKKQRREKEAMEAKMRLRSKSMSTLKYVYQNPLQEGMRRDPGRALMNAAGIPTTNMAHARPSNNGLNLTFRDMLDEGDGREGDLNLRSRNQAWKDFRSFSNRFEEDNPMMAAAQQAMDDDARDGNGNDRGGGNEETKGEDDDRDHPRDNDNNNNGNNGNGNLLGDDFPSKSSQGSVNTAASTNSSSNSNNSSNNPALSGSKRTLNNHHGAFGNAPPLARSLAGSHRAAVSVNDLAVLRRAASRMKMNNLPTISDAGKGGRQQRQSSSSSSASALRPGETLGGDLLSRVSGHASGNASSGSRHSNGGGDVGGAMSPLAQMMARKATIRSSGAAGVGVGVGGVGNNNGGNGGGGDGFSNSAQRDLFFQKFNLAVSAPGNNVVVGGGGGVVGTHPGNSQFAPSPASSGGMGMGRRVRTVGAGLAYGRANMTDTIDYKSGFRLSRFDLGDLRKVSSRLSEVSSKGSMGSAGRAGGGGRNEEWDLS